MMVAPSGKTTSDKGRGSSFARGRVTSVLANRLIISRTQFCAVKAYMFAPETDNADVKRFTDH
ncbi:hypothetical protein PY650_14855 [Rhizobium calliandrae]|uniref:Uncharacterized protein n=1 Tax=Rhizobium calliandrae TaxID=1312182 RepID=A0ABT7KE81_9HYPH|nr:MULTISPECIES: hypothetical protein [Rhizobium]MDL2406917.1 hypothetical protein [Rhizobium calliandrae]